MTAQLEGRVIILLLHRSTVSPIFTSGKMKGMVNFIEEVSNRLVHSFQEVADNGKPIDMKEVFGKFSMDTIASCAFGMDAQSFSSTNSPFVQNARSVFR